MKKFFRILDNLERKLQQYFWLPVSIIACSIFSFNNSNYYRSSSNLTPVTILEVKPKISVASTNAIAINGGAKQDGDGFLPIGKGSKSGGSKSGNSSPKVDKTPDRLQPRYIEINPTPRRGFNLRDAFGVRKVPSTLGSQPNPNDPNGVHGPNKEDYDTDYNSWIRDDDEGEDNSENPSILKPDSKSEISGNGYRTLIVPNDGRQAARGEYTRVELEQMVTHMHHAPGHGIILPDNFSLAEYKRLGEIDKSDQFNYVMNNVPLDTLYEYQNKVAKSICPKMMTKQELQGGKIPFRSVPGVAGRYKRPTELTITPDLLDPNKFYVGIIGERKGNLISSIPYTEDQLRKLIKNDFWVLKDRDI